MVALFVLFLVFVISQQAYCFSRFYGVHRPKGLVLQTTDRNIEANSEAAEEEASPLDANSEAEVADESQKAMLRNIELMMKGAMQVDGSNSLEEKLTNPDFVDSILGGLDSEEMDIVKQIEDSKETFEDGSYDGDVSEFVDDVILDQIRLQARKEMDLICNTDTKTDTASSFGTDLNLDSAPVAMDSDMPIGVESTIAGLADGDVEELPQFLGGSGSFIEEEEFDEDEETDEDEDKDKMKDKIKEDATVEDDNLTAIRMSPIKAQEDSTSSLGTSMEMQVHYTHCTTLYHTIPHYTTLYTL